MNFLEAVTALKNGECKGIKPDYDGAATYVTRGDYLSLGDGSGMRRSVEDLLGDWQLVNPKPQTETREIIGYSVVFDSGESMVFGLKSCAEIEAERYEKQFGHFQIIPLTGTVELPVKPKVKHREDISEVVGCGHFTVNGVLIPKHAKTFAEWED